MVSLEQSKLWDILRLRFFIQAVHLVRYPCFGILLIVFFQGFQSFVVFFSSLTALIFLFDWFLFEALIRSHREGLTIRKAVEAKEEINLFDLLDFEGGELIKEGIDFWRRYHLAYFSYDVLLYEAILKSQSKFILHRLGIPHRDILRRLKEKIETLKKNPESLQEQRSLAEFLWNCVLVAQKREKDSISFSVMFSTLVDYADFWRSLLIDYQLKKEDVENVAMWQERLMFEEAHKKQFWEYRNLLQLGKFAYGFIGGYTITLDKFSIDLTERIKNKLHVELIHHSKELGMLERILAKETTNSVLLVGEAGVGKKSIVHDFARRSLLSECDPLLKEKRVVELDLVSFLAQVNIQEELERLLQEIGGEVIRAGNVILFIQNLDHFVGQEGKGHIDIVPILATFLQTSQFQIIATTSPLGLHRMTERNPLLLSFFTVVTVDELSLEETLEFLMDSAGILEKRYKVFILFPALRVAAELSQKYIQATPFPEKASNLLEETLVFVSQTLHEKIVIPEHVMNVASQITHIPLGTVEKNERELLLHLEKRIHERIINQEEAVLEIASALRRARSGISTRKGPMGTFLFLGPTGVGKTETSKALAEIYFGSEERMIRVDMSEYQRPEDLTRLLGSPQRQGTLTDAVRSHPFALILLDEIEKAHPDILNIFLQILDEGFVTDGLGKKVSFIHTIIIATSNAGYQVILDALKEKRQMQEIKDKLIDFLFHERIFRPEFLNRFDAVVVFRALERHHLIQITDLLLKKVVKNLKEKHIDFVVSDALKEKIVDIGHSPLFGARNIRRVIQDKVENVLAQALLSGAISPGDRIEIDPGDFRIVIN